MSQLQQKCYHYSTSIPLRLRVGSLSYEVERLQIPITFNYFKDDKQMKRSIRMKFEQSSACCYCHDACNYHHYQYPQQHIFAASFSHVRLRLSHSGNRRVGWSRSQQGSIQLLMVVRLQDRRVLYGKQRLLARNESIFHKVLALLTEQHAPEQILAAKILTESANSIRQTAPRIALVLFCLTDGKYHSIVTDPGFVRILIYFNFLFNLVLQLISHCIFLDHNARGTLSPISQAFTIPDSLHQLTEVLIPIEGLLAGGQVEGSVPELVQVLQEEQLLVFRLVDVVGNEDHLKTFDPNSRLGFLIDSLHLVPIRWRAGIVVRNDDKQSESPILGSA